LIKDLPVLQNGPFFFLGRFTDIMKLIDVLSTQAMAGRVTGFVDLPAALSGKVKASLN